MLDWFPDTPSADPEGDLGRWQSAMSMRRVARSVDALDPATRGHSERVATLAARIAAELGWSARRVERVREAAGIHDVGKVCLPREVLLTPGPLSPAEYEIIKTHAPIGGQLAATVLSRHQAEWIRHHHERWDGRGYPDRLAGSAIPEGATIIGLADAWDAMTSQSWSRVALTESEALEECLAESGGQFSPRAVAALIRVATGGSRRPAATPAGRLGSRLRLISAA